MKSARIFFILSMVLFAMILSAQGLAYGANIAKHETPQYEPPPAFAPDQVVVAFKPGTPGEAKRSAHAQVGGRVLNSITAFNADLVGIPNGTVLEKIGIYQRNPNVRFAEPNFYLLLNTPPSEGSYEGFCSTYAFDEQWWLHNLGQAFQIDPDTGLSCAISGASDADIDWLEVWESSFTSAENINIAVLDTGIDSYHPDLGNKIIETWVATLIPEGPEDLIGHGTHVAGIAAASTNNGIGISGVGINANIGSLKACQCYPDPTFCFTGICSEFDVAEALDYASAQNYQVVNMSFGGPHAQVMQDAVSRALNAGLLLVAAAGNSYLHDVPSYPAAYEGVIAVAATDYYDNLASFSNFGGWVELAAPGVEMLSTYPGAGCGEPDCYTYMSGTSMASPVVAGAAALVFDKLSGDYTNPLTLRDGVRDTIFNSADQTGVLGQNMLAWTQYGRLNIDGALAGTTSYPPSVTISSPADGHSFDSAISISFVGSASDTEDGDLTASLVWTSNLDGQIGTGGSFSAVLSDGTHIITAGVTDSGGKSGSDSITITVSGGSSGGEITLSVTAYKVRGRQYADLTWNTSTNVVVYRDGSIIATMANGGAYTDITGANGGGSATYQVCEDSTSNCSNVMTVSW